MQIPLDAIRRAGLNKGRDALTGVETHNGVTGEMVSDPNCKNIAPLFLAQVHKGAISYRRITMEKPYARVGENGVGYSGPSLPDEKTTQPQIGVFGPHADEIVSSPETGLAAPFECSRPKSIADPDFFGRFVGQGVG